MNFKVTRVELLNVLSTVSRAVSAKSPVPALTGIKIEAQDDILTFTGSDSDISIHATLKASDTVKLEISEPGSITLSARYICEIVRKIEDELITIEVLDGTLTHIYGEASDFKINGFASVDYPKIDFSKPEQCFTLESETLKGIIAQTIFAASDKETRPVLTGVNIKYEKGNINFVATDSYRLAKKIISKEEDLNFLVTIPARTLNEVSKSLELAKEVEFAVNDRKAQFILGDTIIQSRLIEGAYPETSRLIPTQFETVLTINSHDLVSAIDRASLLKNDGINIVKLSMSDGKVEISSKSQEVGSANETVTEASYTGNDLEISFSGKYAVDAVRAIGAEIVKISFSGNMKPFVFTNEADDSCLQLILPVRTY